MEQERTPTPIDEVEDVLGLDQPLKLKKRIKIARIDNQRIFSTNGIPYIIKNHNQLTRTLSRNDRHFIKKYPLASKKQKSDHEYNNLVSVLQFYQLWCHGLFPKANFKDCIQLVRGLGAKSPQLKLYRLQLVEVELNKLRVEKGIIDNVPDIEGEEEPVRETTATGEEPSEVQGTNDDNDDWDFMNVAAPRNRFFVADDDDDEDLYQVPEHPVETRSIPNNTAPEQGENKNPTDSDAFSDYELEFAAGAASNQLEDDNDLELMREFGI